MPAKKRKAQRKVSTSKADEAELQRLNNELLEREADVSVLVNEVMDLRNSCPEVIMKLFSNTIISNLAKLDSGEIDESYDVPQVIVNVANSLEDLVDIDSLKPIKQELICDLEKMRLRVDETDRHADLLTSALTDAPVVVLPKARYLSRLSNLSFL